MNGKREAREYLVRTGELDSGEAIHVSHPMNERSEIIMQRLSDRTGLSHLGISLARVPPGKESFALHVHTMQEEWIYVLSGAGHVRIDDEELAIRSGDFVGFPPNGPAHLIRNTSDADLVFLQGGDRREGDRGYFPELRRVGFRHNIDHMALIPEDQIEIRPYTDWLKKKPS